MRTKTFGIYDANNHGIDTEDAGTAAVALKRFFERHDIPEDQHDGYWAEEIDA